MSFCNSNKDACCLKAGLDEVEESTSKTQAVIEKALKVIQSTEGSKVRKYSNIKEERIRNIYKLNVSFHDRNIVDLELPGMSMKEAASEASARPMKIMRSQSKTTRNRQEKQIQCHSHWRYHLCKIAVKNYNVTANHTMRVKKKKENMMMKELVLNSRSKSRIWYCLSMC